MKINRSSIYYKPVKSNTEEEIKAKEAVLRIWQESHKNYGTRRIKKQLAKDGISLSRRRISRIMKELGIKSSYDVKRFKPPVAKGCNEASIANVLNREFDNRAENEVIVSDLTYVRVDHEWNYICTLVDLSNREIVGWSVGDHKTSELVMWAIAGSKIDFKKTKVFHTDRGNEFCNSKLDKFLDKNQITRSLSHKGTPYDNAVAESTYKAIKTEFVKGTDFGTLENLKLQFSDYVHWFNNCRLHSSLNYLTPAEFKKRQTP